MGLYTTEVSSDGVMDKFIPMNNSTLTTEQIAFITGESEIPPTGGEGGAPIDKKKEKEEKYIPGQTDKMTTESAIDIDRLTAKLDKFIRSPNTNLNFENFSLDVSFKERIEDPIDDIIFKSLNPSLFTTEGQEIVALESAKDGILQRLYTLAAEKLYKLDASFQEIADSKGDIATYTGYDLMSDTAESLTDITKSVRSSSILGEYLKYVQDGMQNLNKHRKEFMDAFSFNVGSIQQSYITAVASIIYAETYIITTFMDYERRDENIEYEKIFDATSKINHGIPKFMIDYLVNFNKLCVSGELNKIVSKSKISTEGVMLGTVLVVSVALFLIIPLMRYIIYYFANLKIRISDFLLLQAEYLEINIHKLERQGANEKIIMKQQRTLSNLKKHGYNFRGEVYIDEFKTKISKGKYIAEKETKKETDNENKEVSANSNYDNHEPVSNAPPNVII